MEPRQERGLVLAATKKIQRYGDRWKVPSQFGYGFYMVDTEREQCSCPDWETRRLNCKHIYAALYVMRREYDKNGQMLINEVVAIASADQRPTYPQVWQAYNAAQTNEKDMFQSLLADLCRGFATPAIKKTGRPSLPLSDAIFAVAFKVYSTVSARRFMSDLRSAQERGFISKTPHYNSIYNYLENPEMTPILRSLIVNSSLPLQSVETDFAVDSSGFMTTRFVLAQREMEKGRSPLV